MEGFSEKVQPNEMMSEEQERKAAANSRSSKTRRAA
jgi:hypothetical protein